MLKLKSTWGRVTCSLSRQRGGGVRCAGSVRPGRGERGVALLMVLTLLTLLGTVVADFQYSSRVDLQLAMNARDEVQAEYNALSALRLRAMLLKQSRKLEAALKMVAPLLGMDASAMPSIGQMLEMIPVECSLMSTITREAGAELGGESGSAEDFFPGECIATSESEHSKIPINVMGNKVGVAAQQTATLVLGILADRRLERHFQEDDRSGSHAEDPAELVSAIADWIDGDKVQTGSVSDEDRFYTNLKDSYRAKNAPFDSLEEVQLVHGIDDELWAILRPHLSVHNDSPSIELGTAPEQRVYLALTGALREGVGAEMLFTHPGFVEMVRGMRELREASFGMLPLNVALLTGLVNASGLGAIVDTAKLTKVYSDQSSTTWYTIEAQGRLGNATRRIRAVFQASEGQFYYFRVE